MTKHIAALLTMLTLSLAAESTQLFNGRDLTGWKIADIPDSGQVKVLPDGIVECGVGHSITGIAYTNKFPTMNYELSLEGMRKEGYDFFIALTIPVEKSFCTIIIGGWGGGLCGISSYDFNDAANNQWAEGLSLKNNQWYTLRVRVTPGVLQITLNKDLYTARVEFDDCQRLSLRFGEMEKTVPLGLSTFETKAHWRNFTVTEITELLPEDKPREEE